jgi:hypothetical protein
VAIRDYGEKFVGHQLTGGEYFRNVTIKHDS